LGKLSDKKNQLLDDRFSELFPFFLNVGSVREKTSRGLALLASPVLVSWYVDWSESISRDLHKNGQIPTYA
jgi:hypothetical protein